MAVQLQDTKRMAIAQKLADIAILNDLYLTPVPSPVLGEGLGAADVFHN
ncbi:MAG: hypothetical protein ACRC8Y_01630 [Chroococcales cyanobacterium]